MIEVHAPKRKGAWWYISWVTIGLAVCLLGWTGWSFLWPFTPLHVASKAHFTVANPNKTVSRGEALKVVFDYCQETTERVQLDSDIEQDSRVMLLSTQYPTIKSGCHKVNVPIVVIPKNLALESTTAAGDGKAIVRATYRYKINALRDVTYTFVTDEFTINP